MENLHDWDREDKLFVIRALSESRDEERSSYLLQLVLDEDPVIRGKAALAMQNLGDEDILRGADVLLDEDEVEKTILACELLGFTEDVDFTDRVEPLLDAEDDRVVRSVIEILDNLPEKATKRLLERVVDQYRDAWRKSLLRLLGRMRPPGILSVLQRLASCVDNEGRLQLLRVAARVGGPEAADWIEKELRSLEVSDEKRAVIDWLSDR